MAKQSEIKQRDQISEAKGRGEAKNRVWAISMAIEWFYGWGCVVVAKEDLQGGW